METYPGELLVGVFPLVFCVDATISPEKSAVASSGAAEGAPHSRSRAAALLFPPDPNPSPRCSRALLSIHR